MALLSPANPKCNFLSGGKQEQHVNERSAVHSYDQWEQPNTLLITLGHLPVLVCFKCSRKAALSTALEVTVSREERAGRLKKTPCPVLLGRVPFETWRADLLPKANYVQSAPGEHGCPSPGFLKELTLLPSPDSRQQRQQSAGVYVPWQYLWFARWSIWLCKFNVFSWIGDNSDWIYAPNNQRGNISES